MKQFNFLFPSDADKANLCKQIADTLGDGYSVERNAMLYSRTNFSNDTFDIVIYHNGSPYAVGLYSNYPIIWDNDYCVQSFVRKKQKIGVKYGFIYLHIQKYVYFFSADNSLKKISLEVLLSALKKDNPWGSEPNSTAVKDALFQSTNFRNETKTLFKGLKNNLLSLFTSDTLVYDSQRGTISLKKNYEDELYKLLLPGISSTHLCRYTSLNSLFLLLKNKVHCMCNITCMNDKGEENYPDVYLGYGYSLETFLTVEDNNRCFILSCCSEENIDNLTMWRLYAQDGKGACIEYKVNPDIIDNQNFFFSPVSYGKSINVHPELDIIRGIIDHEIDGWTFKLNRWNIWKHFFKSYLFADEKEYRLLYLPPEDENDPSKIEWIMDSSNNIVSRICKLPMGEKEFPLSITSAIIGPKCPQQSSNVNQFNYMNSKQKVIFSKNWKDAIRCSEIKDYR
jgi:hypothetical protein